MNNRIKIGVVGSKIWINYFYESFKDDEIFDVKLFKSPKLRISNIREVDLLYVIFGSFDKDYLFLYMKSILYRKPIIIHWIGTDVYRMVNYKILSLKSKIKSNLFKFIIKTFKYKFYHIACAPWLKEELNLVGISSEFIPVISPMVRRDIPIYPLPEKLSVLSYIPLGREDFYGEDKLLELIRRNPDVHFIIVANSPERKPKDLDNCEYYGWVSKDNMEELYKKVSCVIRITRHDGLPGLGIEALLRGRYLIFTYEHPYVYRAKTAEEAQAALEDIKLKREPNYEGARFVRENYSSEIVKDKLKRLFMGVL